MEELNRQVDASPQQQQGAFSRVSGSSFFKRADRGAALERLQHFIRFSDALLLVSGPLGSGKSQILNQFRNSLGAECVLAQVGAGGSSDQDALYPQLMSQWGVGWDDKTLVSWSAETVLSLLQEAPGATYLLLIDDAGTMPPDVLEKVLGLYRSGLSSQQVNLHLIMASEPGFHARLSMLLGEGAALHTINLPPLSLQEVGEYLRLKLADAGVTGEVAFEHSDIDAAWRRSGGIPALIDQWLDARLKDRQQSQAAAPSPVAKRNTGGRSLIVIASLAILLMGLPMAYLYWDSISDRVLRSDSAVISAAPEYGAVQPEYPLQAADNSEEVTPEAVSVSQGSPRESVTLQQAQPVTASGFEGDDNAREWAVSPELEGAQVVADSKTVVTAHSAPASDSSERVSALADDVAESEGALQPQVMVADEEVAGEKLSEMQPQKQTLVQNLQETVESSGLNSEVVDDHVPSLALSSQNPSSLAEFTRSEQLLLEEPGGAYVIQVLAAASEAAVARFVQQQSNRAELLVYTALRKGEPWQVVVLPGFSDLAEAKKAVEKLPERQRKQGAWPRPIVQVKSEIRQYHNK